MREKLKNLISKCPFSVLLVSMGILFSLTGLCGRRNVYAGQEYDPAREPALALMFKGIKEDIYPWQIFERNDIPVMASGEGNNSESDEGGEMAVSDHEEEAETQDKDEGENASGGEAAGGDEKPAGGSGSIEDEKPAGETESSREGETAAGEKGQEGETAGEEEEPGETGNSSAGAGKESTGEEGTDNQTAQTVSSKKDQPKTPIEPLRESTREEYLNHISADIYGDAGVKRAAEYEFVQVDESYFDDALFIGDSRTVGLQNYTDLSEHADFYCETSLTIQKTLKENFPGKGTVEEALANKDYGKIYIMLGINELGVGTTEDFLSEYAEVIDFFRETEPEAKIFVQGIMRVTGKKHSSDAIFNNNNINARNNAIATLADNEQIFYIDVNEVVCDEEGNLNSEYTYDQLHLLGMYNDIWKQFLLSHGVTNEE